MRRVHRIVLLVALIAIAPVLAGCEGFDGEKFDIFNLNEKKKLKGERKEMFPEGVPGVTQGLPPEYIDKLQQSANAQTPAALPANTAAGAPNDKAAALAQPGKTAAVEPMEEPKPKAKPKRKPKQRTAARPAAKVIVQPAAQKPNGGQQQASPWPDQKPAQAPWPEQKPAQAPWPAQKQSESTSPWPAAPPPGTFSR